MYYFRAATFEINIATIGWRPMRKLSNSVANLATLF